LNPTKAGYKQSALNDFFSRVQQRVAALPGVTGVTASFHLLLGDGKRSNTIWLQGFPSKSGQMNVDVVPVGADFFHTMKIPLLRGRDFTDRDTEHAPKVAVVNEAFVRRYLEGREPIGKHIRFASAPPNAEMEIVGVARDTKYDSLREDVSPTVYHPFQQVDDVPFMYFEVRTAMNPITFVPAVRSAVASVDRDIPLFDVKTETQQVDEMLSQEGLFAKLTSFFGFVALLLACVGLYGILSYAVARRTHEIGIRMALGAQRTNVLRMLLREVAVLLAVGISIGVLVSLAAVRLASSIISDLLFGLKATDALTITLAALPLVTLSVLAAFFPAWRAMRVDPMVALRYE
jgi:predicted permease